MKLTTLILPLIIFIFSSCSKKATEVQLNPLIRNFKPQEQLFKIKPQIKNIITGQKGTRLIIHKNAFKLDYEELSANSIVVVRLTEYIDNFDFITSGIDLTYRSSEGRDVLFESAGMFKVQAQYENKELELLNTKNIDVLFPNVVPGDKFQVYKINRNGQWERDGSSQESKVTPRAEPRFERDSESFYSKNKAYIGIRKYAIDELTYWNFDLPRSDSAWMVGQIDLDINSKNKIGYQVFIIGISNKGYWQGWSVQKKYSAQYFQNTVVKILIVTEDGRVGFSRPFNTGKRFGHYKSPEYSVQY